MSHRPEQARQASERQQERQQHQEPRSEFDGFSIFSPVVMYIERYATKRRESVVRKRAFKRDRYNTGTPVEVIGGDGSITRVISVEAIPAENTVT